VGFRQLPSVLGVPRAGCGCYEGLRRPCQIHHGCYLAAASRACRQLFTGSVVRAYRERFKPNLREAMRCAK